MKKETPRSSKRRAGLADGLTTVAPVAGMPTTGRAQRQKRSPKEQSAGSGTLIQVSQVVFDHPERDHAIGWAKGDGSAPASRIARRHGDSLVIPDRGCRPVPSARALSNQQNLSQQLLISEFLEGEFRMKIETKIARLPDRMTAAEFRQAMSSAPAPKRANKYGATRITADGYTFDSLGEKARYDNLKLMVAGKLISDLSVHPRFPLRVAGEPIAEIELDFAYTERGQRVVEDFKGVLTRVFRMKRKHFLAQYKHIELRVINRKGQLVPVRTRAVRKEAA